MDWDDLKIFLEVADRGTMGAAARALDLAQPTISQRIRQLEGELGVQLLVRRTNGVALTEAGQRVRDHALTMRTSANTIEESERARDQLPRGRVRVSAPDGIASFCLAPRLHTFLDAYPEMAVALDAGLWPGDPVSDEVELSIQFEETKAHDHIVHKLATVHYAFFASAAYVERNGLPACLEDVPQQRILTHTAYRRQPERWDPKVLTLNWRGKPEFETNSSAAFMAALVSGAGVALAPTYMTTLFNNLVMVGEQPSASLSLWLVYQRDAGKVARLRVLIEWLKAACDPAANPWFADAFVHPRDFPPR